MSGLSSPLQPSPRPVAPSPASKKAKSSNGENGGIARTLFQPTEPRTRTETLLPDTLDEPLPHALSVVHHASVISSFLQLHRGFQGLTSAHPPMWLQDCRESQGLNQVPYPTAGQAHPHALSVVHHALVISPFLQLHQGFQGLTPAHPPMWLQDCRESQGPNQVPYPTSLEVSQEFHDTVPPGQHCHV